MGKFIKKLLAVTLTAAMVLALTSCTETNSGDREIQIDGEVYRAEGNNVESDDAGGSSSMNSANDTEGSEPSDQLSEGLDNEPSGTDEIEGVSEGGWLNADENGTLDGALTENEIPSYKFNEHDYDDIVNIEHTTEDSGDCEHEFCEKRYFNDYPCLSAGQYTRTCVKCGFTESGWDEEIIHGENRVVVVQKATCGQIGKTEIYCKICGNYISGYETSYFGGHDFGESDIEGYKKCKVCGYYERIE